MTNSLTVSPFPWYLSGEVIRSARGDAIAFVALPEGIDPQFIVKACNSFEDLVIVLEESIEKFDGDVPGNWLAVLNMAKGE